MLDDLANMVREKEFKPTGRLWLHIKILYLLLCLLCLSLTIICFLLLHARHVNLDKSESELQRSTFQGHTGLLRMKRYLTEAKTAEDRITNRKARKITKTRNQSTQSDGDWVWMSSFSRIPSHILQSFCASTKDYCPAGFPGLSGLPGKKGESGSHGENGIPGKDGVRGADGAKGTIGQKGEPGIQGPLGVKGAIGLTGEKGSYGENGAPGRRGEKGDKGDKGEVQVQVRNCSCPQGPKGHKGEPGYVNSDSLVNWMKDFDKQPKEIPSSSSPMANSPTETQVAEFD